MRLAAFDGRALHCGWFGGYATTAVCPKCKNVFPCNREWGYVHNGKRYCSWSCVSALREAERTEKVLARERYLLKLKKRSSGKRNRRTHDPAYQLEVQRRRLEKSNLWIETYTERIQSEYTDNKIKRLARKGMARWQKNKLDAERRIAEILREKGQT